MKHAFKKILKNTLTNQTPQSTKQTSQSGIKKKPQIILQKTQGSEI